MTLLDLALLTYGKEYYFFSLLWPKEVCPYRPKTMYFWRFLKHDRALVET